MSFESDSKDEEFHIARCLDWVAPFATHCLVVDSGSTDRTIEIAKANRLLKIEAKN